MIAGLRARVIVPAAIAALIALAGTARGDGRAPAATASPAAKTAPGGRPAKRPVPNYDGRGPAPEDTVDGLLFLPRVILFPVRIAVDYGIRRPIGAAVRAIESSRTLRRAFQYLFLRPKTPTPQIIPVALYDFGFKPSIGARLYWGDGYLTPGSQLSIKLGTGGTSLWRADASTRIALGTTAFVGADLGARQRPDYVFHGLGPDTESDARARYQDRRLHATVRVGAAIPGWGEAAVFGGWSRHRYESSTYRGDPSIEDQVAAGEIAELPAGYPDGHANVRAGATVALDTRARAARRRSSGARLDATVEQVWDASDRDQRWTRIDATAGAALLLDPVGERKLDLKLRVQRVDPAMGTEVPFVELPTTGGLRGFAGGRLRGETALALTADYDWPIAAWLDAHAHAGLGNVFGPDLHGLSAGALRGSAGLGLSIAGLSAERQVRLAAAVGTEPLRDGVDVSSFRLVLGFANDY